MRRIAVAVCLLTAVCALADERFPSAGWEDYPNPLTSPHAATGGEMTVYAGPYPQSLNYYLANNVLSADVFGSLYDALLDMNPVTAEYEPGLAERWTIGDDKKTFTFWLDPRARWSDGRPITAQDVKWTFDAIMDPKNLTGVHKVSLEKFDPPVVVSNLVIRFTCREVHWRNLGALGGINVLPRHACAALDFNKINFEFPVVSGPFRIAELREGIFLRLGRRRDWWHGQDLRYRRTLNFDGLLYRFYEESENAFEAFKKGQIDVFPVHMARLWVEETKGDKFEKNWIVKQKVLNYNPIGFQGFAMNMRRRPFDDLRVREAMARLLDREKMNRTLMYSQYFLQRSYFEDLYTKDVPCTNALFGFDKEQARRLLKAAGWVANAKTGLQEKNGQPFTFRFLSRDASTDKFLAIYGEDLKDAGIEMKIEKKDWASWSKDMEEFNFDMTWAAWSEGLFKDPEGMWASKEAARRGGNNITGFQDAQVDAMIERQKDIFDLNKRHAICREIDAIVTRAVPYVLLWNLNYSRLLYWNKFGTPPTVLSKYGDDRSAYAYWWFDPDAAADLKAAVESQTFLPPKKPEVVFDDEFRPPAK